MKRFLLPSARMSRFSRRMRGWLGLLGALLCAGAAWSQEVPVRIVAANLSSGRHQTYSPDNTNHSNPDGAGARILKALGPDIVLIQEFRTAVPTRQWVNATFGEEFQFFVEELPGVENPIPNGIVTRFPIVASGAWDDPEQENREFAWAKIALPGGRKLWAISVHLSASKPTRRVASARALARRIAEAVPKEDLVVIGGDLNTATREEPCLAALAHDFDTPFGPPVDGEGNSGTNVPRRKPYDWVLADREMSPFSEATRIAGQEFPGGLVFDSRVFEPLEDMAPVQHADSAVPGMQHMAVVRDFLIPATSAE